MTEESREFRGVQKGKNGIFVVGGRSNDECSTLVLLPYKCHNQYNTDALATAPQDFEDRFGSTLYFII